MGVWVRPGLLSIGCALVLLPLVGCELEDADAASEQQVRPFSDDGESPVEAGISGESASPGPAVVEHLESCVEQTKARAFVGDEFWGGVWADLAHDESQLRSWCSDLAVSDPEVLANIHAEWLEFSAAIATAAPDPPAPDLPPTPDVAAPAPTPQPVVAESADSCHPSYDPCVPIGADADCASGSGDGPIYVAHPVRILGPDEYGLDGNDNDGLGCENE